MDPPGILHVKTSERSLRTTTILNVLYSSGQTGQNGLNLYEYSDTIAKRQIQDYSRFIEVSSDVLVELLLRLSLVPSNIACRQGKSI